MVSRAKRIRIYLTAIMVFTTGCGQDSNPAVSLNTTVQTEDCADSDTTILKSIETVSNNTDTPEATTEPIEEYIGGEETISDDKVIDNPEIVMEVTPLSLSVSELPANISMTVTNPDIEREYRGSYHYSIERFVSEAWIPVYLPCCVDLELIILPGEAFEINYIELNPSDYEYDAGEYRVNFNNCCYGYFIIVE